jgi:hypothetical protein
MLILGKISNSYIIVHVTFYHNMLTASNLQKGKEEEEDAREVGAKQSIEIEFVLVHKLRYRRELLLYPHADGGELDLLSRATPRHIVVVAIRGRTQELIETASCPVLRLQRL